MSSDPLEYDDGDPVDAVAGEEERSANEGRSAERANGHSISGGLDECRYDEMLMWGNCAPDPEFGSKDRCSCKEIETRRHWNMAVSSLAYEYSADGTTVSRRGYAGQDSAAVASILGSSPFWKEVRSRYVVFNVCIKQLSHVNCPLGFGFAVVSVNSGDTRATLLDNMMDPGYWDRKIPEFGKEPGSYGIWKRCVASTHSPLEVWANGGRVACIGRELIEGDVISLVFHYEDLEPSLSMPRYGGHVYINYVKVQSFEHMIAGIGGEPELSSGAESYRRRNTPNWLLGISLSDCSSVKIVDDIQFSPASLAFVTDPTGRHDSESTDDAHRQGDSSEYGEEEYPPYRNSGGRDVYRRDSSNAMTVDNSPDEPVYVNATNNMTIEASRMSDVMHRGSSSRRDAGDYGTLAGEEDRMGTLAYENATTHGEQEPNNGTVSSIESGESTTEAHAVRQPTQAIPTTASAVATVPVSGHNTQCVICLDGDKCIVLMPCKHLCVCEECYFNGDLDGEGGGSSSRGQVGRNPRKKCLQTCPICRSHVLHYLKVYCS